MKAKNQFNRPIMRPGCTVMLASEIRRAGSYLLGLKEYQPYRCKEIKGAMIWILTAEGSRPFHLHCFDPVACKFGLYEKVVIYNSKRKIYSSPMRVEGYSNKSYLLSNSNHYDALVLTSVSESQHILNKLVVKPQPQHDCCPF